MCLTVASCLLATLLPQVASADDDLDIRRAKVQAELNRSEQELGESSARLSSAAVAVQSAQTQLAAARRELAGTRQELRVAKARDVALGAKLKQAQANLAKATAAVVAGQRRLNAEKDMAGAIARDQYQQQTVLLPLALLTQSRSIADLQTRLQWSTTMFDSTQALLTRLTTLQQRLTTDKARQAVLEQQVATDRAAAAANLVVKRRLEGRAARQTSTVAGLVRRRAAVQAKAAQAVLADRREVIELNRERVSVERRIAIRIAKAKAAARAEAIRQAKARAEAVRVAKAKARAARIAREKAAAEQAARAAARRAARAERAQQTAAAKRARRAAAGHRARAARLERKRDQATASSRARRTAPAKQRRSAARSSGGAARNHGFVYPVAARITSPYGRRFHPILRRWKLHDGTDFGARCGTPIRAAYSGRVEERYYNGAYGHRLMIDHGRVDGRYITTGYNHATRYKVRVGQRVRRGQVIGYVGSTGYSTGCHLHLMLWRDGRLVNPMSWF